MRSVGLYVFVSSYCGAILVAVLVAKHASQFLWCAGMLAVALILGCASGANPGRVCALAFCACVLAFMRVAFVPRDLPSAFLPLLDAKVPIEGTVVELPDLRESSQRITILLARGGSRTRIIASAPLYPVIHVGDVVEARGSLKRPQSFATDGGRTFAYPEFLAKDGVFAVMQPASVSHVAKSRSFWLRFLRCLEWLRAMLTRLLGDALPEPESSLAVGLIVGGKQGLGKQLLDDFTRAGMLQIVVLSGYNVMIVANALMRILSRASTRVSYVLASGSILSFVLLAGAGSSALRAGLMAFLGLSARTFGKRYDLLSAIALSVFLLSLWNPLLVPYDPGFQFSFIATLGLALGTPLIAPQLALARSPVLIELVATTLAAEIALVPLLLWQTGNLSLISVAANVLAMPAVAPAMALSAGAALVAAPLGLLSPWLPPLAGLPAYVPLRYIIAIATHAAALPFSTVTIPAFPFWPVAAAYVAFATIVWRSSRQPRPGSAAPPPTS